jgi:hypothetical protein
MRETVIFSRQFFCAETLFPPTFFFGGEKSFRWDFYSEVWNGMEGNRIIIIITMELLYSA